MKHKILLVFFCASNMLALAVTHNIDSSRSEQFVSGAWANYYRSINFFEAGCGRQVATLNYSWNAGTMHWDSASSATYNYNGSGDVSDYYFNFGNGGHLSPYTHMVDSYSGSLLSQEVSQYWKPYLNAFRDQYKTVYHYNASQKADTLWYQTWDTATTSWYVTGHDVYQYDGNGNKIMTTYEAYLPPYTPGNKYNFTFTPTNKVSTKVYSLWDASGSVWVPYDSFTYSYDSNDFLVQYLRQHYSGGGWMNAGKDVYTNNAGGEQLTDIHSVWSGGAWANDYRYTLFPGCALSNGISDLQTAGFKIYPNPASDLLRIELEQPGESDLSVLDMQGRLIRQQPAIDGANTIPIKNLEPGSYLLKWCGQDKVVTKRFLKN